MYSNFKKYSERPTKKKKDKINICIFYKDRVPFDLRLVAVFDIITQNPEYDFFIVHPNDYNKFKEDISKERIYFDYIILQRDYFDFEIANMLLDKSKSLDYKIIYEIDDDLIHMDESNPGYNYYMSIKDKLEHIISNSDIVTVTTVNLKNQIDYLNNRVFVIPNRLIDSWFEQDHSSKSSKSENVIKIGYMGSVYHSWDLILITHAIKNVKDYFSKKGYEIIFEVVGGTTEILEGAEKIEIPTNCQYYFNFVNWFKNVIDWDIAIAPLEESNINLSKSELKYLEYAALRIPGIYSDIGPYSNCIVHGKNGLLVRNNSSKEWEENIIKLIEDIVLQDTIIENSFSHVEKNYSINQSADQWIRIFEENLDISYENLFKRIIKRLLRN